MDTKTFLENFGTIAEATGGIERLRSTIYEMAVHGLLSGGSVSIMETTNAVCLPGWSIKPLIEIATYGGFGQELGSNLPESAWMLDLEDIEKSTSRLLAKVRVSERRSSSSKNLFQKNDVLYAKLRPYLDKVLIADEDGYCTSEIIPIRPGDGVCAEWLRICLKSPTFIDYVSSKSYGMKMPRLGTKDALASMHAVPPLAEQKRIVAKVDELMALCDELEEKQQRKATVTTKLRGSAFNALRQAETPDDLAAAWERISTNWSHLTNHPDSIPELRQTILELAVRGRLVEGNLEGIRAEEMLKELRLARISWLKDHQDELPECSTMLRKLEGLRSVDAPYSVPTGWTCTRLIDLSLLMVDCHNKTAPYSNGGVPIIRTTNVRNGVLDLRGVKTVNEETYLRWSKRCPPESGDIIFTREAPMGEAAIIPDGHRVCLGQRTMLIRPMTGFIDSKYLLVALMEPGLMRRSISNAVGATVKHFRVGDVETIPIMLPPLEEQRRIAHRVQALMSFCDSLETRLLEQQDLSSRLAIASTRLAG